MKSYCRAQANGEWLGLKMLGGKCVHAFPPTGSFSAWATNHFVKNVIVIRIDHDDNNAKQSYNRYVPHFSRLSRILMKKSVCALYAGTTFGNTTSNTNTLFGGSSQPATNTGFGSSNTTFGSTNTGFGGTNTGFGSTNTGFGSTNTGFGSTNTGFGSTRNSLFGNTQTANKGFSFPSTQNTGTGFGTSSNLFSGLF